MEEIERWLSQPAERGTRRLVLQEPGPSHEESRGVHEGLQSGVGDEEQR